MTESMSIAPRILITDDDKTSVLGLSEKLKRYGYDTLIAENGHDCLELLRQEEVSLVLLDINLPGISGLETLAEIRKTKSMTELPVVMVTSESGSSVLVKALSIGANDYLTKPLKIAEAAARVKSQISLREMAAENIKLKETAALNALIVTYNHEINNPLFAAMGMIELTKSTGDVKHLDRAEKSLQRICEIIKKISNIADSPVQIETYHEDTKMLKIK